jgi:hypothetical protein
MEYQTELSQQNGGRRRTRVWIAIALVMLIIGVTAGGCLLQPSQPAAGSGGGNLIQIGGGGSGAPQMFELKEAKVTPAPGMPTGEPDADGLYLRREDQSIFISTGEIEMRVMIPEGGKEPVAEAHANGPTLEVVVNRNTEIYKDITAISMEARRDGLGVQQVVESLDSLEALLEEVSQTDTLTVWGERSGDRIVARMIVYRPFDMPMPPSQ